MTIERIFNMVAQEFDGKAFKEAKLTELSMRVGFLKEKGIFPCLGVVLVGEDMASLKYVEMKTKAAEEIGVKVELVHLNKANEGGVIQSIKVLSSKPLVHGVMVQLPLPGVLDNKETVSRILSNIPREKDVDGLTEDNGYLSATAKAVRYAVEEGIKNSNKKKVAMVFGYTGAVGKEVVKELEKVCEKINGINSKTSPKDMVRLAKEADIIVTATGVPGIVKKNMVKKGAVVIDVGYPEPEVEGNVREVASFITPVPGGIGPATVACLLENLVEAVEKSTGPRLS